MLSIPLATLAVLWAGAFLGALAAGGAGFAFALTASSVWLHVLDPLQTTALVVACGSLLHCALVWPVRRGIELPRLLPFIAGAVVGIPLGVFLLNRVSPGPLKAALAALMVAYGLYALLLPPLPHFLRGGRAADGAIGFAGGILGGLGGFSGVLPTIWTQLRGWPKEIARGVYQPYILFAHIATLLLVGSAAVNAGGLPLFFLALPALALGAWLGLLIYGRLDERRFKQVLALMLIVSGASLVL